MGRSERASLAPSDCRGSRSLLPKRPQGWRRGVRGAPRRAPTHAHPTQAPPSSLAPLPDGVRPSREETELRGESFVRFSLGLSSSGRLSPPLALGRNWRCRSLLSPPLRGRAGSCLPSARGVIETALPGPSLQVPGGPGRARGSVKTRGPWHFSAQTRRTRQPRRGGGHPAPPRGSLPPAGCDFPSEPQAASPRRPGHPPPPGGGGGGAAETPKWLLRG